MNTAVTNTAAENRLPHVIGTTGVAAPAPGRPVRVVLAAPRTYRIRGELVTLPRMPGVAARVLVSRATVRPEQVAEAA